MCLSMGVTNGAHALCVCEFQCLSMGVRAREQWDRMQGVRMTFPHGDDCY